MLRLLGGREISNISISGIAFNPMQFPLRYNNLVELSLPPMSSGRALLLLSHCPALRTCQLKIRGSGDSGSARGPIIEHALVHKLRVDVLGSLRVAVRELFGRLSFPELRHLTVTAGGRSIREVDHVHYSPCFFAAAPRVESLEIDLEMFSKSTLTLFLCGIRPTVQTLRTNTARRDIDIFDDDVLDVLVASPSLSGLQELEINGCRSSSDEALLNFIQIGTSVGFLDALKRVEVFFVREMQVDILPKLQPLVERGLSIELHYSTPSIYAFSPWQGLEDDSDTLT
ncbi:hypothetical protein B0H17DRAFT_1078939 [Mycena rosella]|uniref:Uncharacterized protein n=1 Tax=Mycena rosella TaxID=1033263 RepID=A0AAD7D3Y7_MYCRO|nr:hypothetical protein B0H17DRAFT_1078939 [Mycena rosella]